MKIDRVTLVELTFNRINGLCADVLCISTEKYTRSLFGLNTDFKKFFTLSMFFIEIILWDKTAK
jgi:hypothetical protein